MSRYVTVPLDLTDRAELEAALAALEIPCETGRRGTICLEGSLECAGEPVQLRIAPEVLGTAEDLGFAWDPSRGAFGLVCGEPDRPRVEARLLAPLLAEIARARLEASGATTRLEIDADGTRRLILGTSPGPDDPDDRY